MRYIDHIRNMSDDQLAYFLNAIQPKITLWSLSMTRALNRKPYKGVDSLNGTNGDTRTLMSILYKDYDYEMKLMDEERNQSLDDLHDYASGNDLKRALDIPNYRKKENCQKRQQMHHRQKVRNDMYESPINLIYHESERQIIQEQEQTILKAIIGYDVDVNKEELIKAMNYDRNQYSKGYKDGVNDVLDKIRAEIEEMTPTYHLDWPITDLVSLSDVLKLIDKYKAESEEV